MSFTDHNMLDGQYDAARAVIDKLTAIDGYKMAEVIEAVTGIGTDLFIQLDEKPGYYDGDYAGGDWHWKLRRARNQAPGFFEAINKGWDRAIWKEESNE